MKTNFYFFLGLFVLTAQITIAQTTLKLDSNPELKVSGTSSLHDWEMTSNKATGELKATLDNGKITDIAALSVTMQAESIKSGKSGMDKKAYEALKTNKFQTVTFNLKSATKSGDYWVFNGALSLAGTSKNVSFKATVGENDGKHTISGKHSFKLTDFGIEPPKALMGTIKTGDEVTVSVKLNFK